MFTKVEVIMTIFVIINEALISTIDKVFKNYMLIRLKYQCYKLIQNNILMSVFAKVNIKLKKE